MRLGCVSSEGGPFLLADLAVARAWQGSDEESGYDSQVFDRLPAGPVRTAAGSAFAWDAEGAGTVDVYRVGGRAVLLQRPWSDDATPNTVPERASSVGVLDLPSGVLAVLWSPLSWADLWTPPSAGDVELSSVPMSGIGMLVDVEPGRYLCSVLHDTTACRCWVSPAP